LAKFSLRPVYNSPVVLTFAFAAFLILVANGFFGGKLVPSLFVVYPGFDFKSPVCYFRLFSHVLGHKNWNHLVANLSIVLLIGPILEEKYGSKTLALMMLITALATGILNASFFSTGLLGASGLLFMMILLGSFTNHKDGGIPLTFILVLFLFLAKEVMNAFAQDDISQFAHVMGGICGSLFGFLHGPKVSK
jgi:membrane associated rhomboid family serine protease